MSKLGKFNYFFRWTWCRLMRVSFGSNCFTWAIAFPVRPSIGWSRHEEEETP